jgi:hypothetical protein
MCFLNVKITSYTVTHDAVSVRLGCPDGNNDAMQGLMADKQPKMFHFKGLDVKGVIGSINIRNGVNILLKLPREEYVVKKLWYLSVMETITLNIEGEAERHLAGLIKNVAAQEGKTEEELLYELSTFTNKENRVIEGKRSIRELSPKAQEVIIKKLNRLKAEAMSNV